jgi:ABC-type multidrug transport system fused ATPase/permease subunit
MKQKLIRNKWSILFLLIVSLILILPAIIYQYPYPSISDDVPAYLQVIDKVAHGDLTDSDSYRFCYPTNIFGGESCNYRSASAAVIGLVCRVLNSDPYWTYYIFHYLALIGIALCVWLFCTKVFNKLTGYIGVLFVMFGATPVLRYSYYDQIFNITNLLGFGLMGCLALVYWLKTKRLYYALISMMLFMIAVLFHSSTGLEIYICVGFFLIATVVYKYFKKAWKEVSSVGVYLTVFTVVCGALLYTLSPESKSLFTSVLNGSAVSANMGIHSVVPVWYFFTQDTSLLLLIFGAFGFWYVMRKKIATVGLWMLLAFIFVFTVSVLLNRFEPARSAQDLGIILLLFYAGSIGTALYHTRTLSKIINAKKTIIFIVLVACVPTLYGWFQYHCAITPVDQQAIAEINRLGGTWNCSTQINPNVYDLFIDTPYVIIGADYTIYRSQRQTAATDPNNRYTIVVGNESKISDYNLPRVATYYSEEVTVIIFRSVND